MIVCGAQPVATLRVMASTTVLRGIQMVCGLARGHGVVMALLTAGVLGWERDVTYRPEAAVIHRRQGKTPTGRVTGIAGLASCGCMNIDKDLWSGGRT